MPTATVKAVFVNSPKNANSKWCSIKGEDKLYYNYEQGKFDPVKGRTYVIEFDEKTRDDGSKWRPIKKLTLAEQSGGGTSYTGGVTGPTQSMEIFITGVIGRCFQGTATMPSEQELTSMVMFCKRAWVNGLKANAPSSNSDEPPVPDESDYGQ